MPVEQMWDIGRSARGRSECFLFIKMLFDRVGYLESFLYTPMSSDRCDKNNSTHLRGVQDLGDVRKGLIGGCSSRFKVVLLLRDHDLNLAQLRCRG